MKCRIIFRKIPADSLRRIASRRCNKRFRISKNEARTLARHHRKRLEPIPVARERRKACRYPVICFWFFSAFITNVPHGRFGPGMKLGPPIFFTSPPAFSQLRICSMAPHWIPRPVYPTCHINTDMCFWRDFGHLAIPIRLRILRGMVCARPFLHLNYAEAPRNGHRLARRWDHRPALGGRDHRIHLLLGLKAKCLNSNSYCSFL